jgi:hypothetical protein
LESEFGTAAGVVGGDALWERAGDDGGDREVGRSAHVECPLHAIKNCLLDLAHRARKRVEIEGRKASNPGKSGDRLHDESDEV